MAGKNPGKAVAAFTGPIAEALGCFAHGSLSADVWHPRDGYGILTFNGNEYFPVGRNGKVKMSMMMQYEIVEGEGARGPWKVTTTGWIYNLEAKDETKEFHWHPVSDSHMKDPHVHLNGEKTHNPTGRVLIEDVLELARELGADCLNPGRWATLAPKNRTNFGLGATWGQRKTIADGEPMRWRPAKRT